MIGEPQLAQKRAADFVAAVARHFVMLQLSLGQLERIFRNQQHRRERAAGRALAIAAVAARLHHGVRRGLRSEPHRTCIRQQFFAAIDIPPVRMLCEREALELFLGRFHLDQSGAKFFRRSFFFGTAREVRFFAGIVAHAIQMIAAELAHRPERQQIAGADTAGG